MPLCHFMLYVPILLRYPFTVDTLYASAICKRDSLDMVVIITFLKRETSLGTGDFEWMWLWVATLSQPLFLPST